MDLQVDETDQGRVSLGLSVTLRVSLRDGTYHEVHNLGVETLACELICIVGYWIWSHRELQRQSRRL